MTVIIYARMNRGIGVLRERVSRRGAGAVWALLLGASLALVFRYGFFGVSSLSLVPSSSAFKFVLLALACALIIRVVMLPFVRGRFRAHLWSALTFAEWVCWVFLSTDPFLSVYLYLAFSLKLPASFSLYDKDLIALLAAVFVTALLSVWGAWRRRNLCYVPSFYLSAGLAVLAILYSLVIPTYRGGMFERSLACRTRNVESIISCPCPEHRRPWCSLLFSNGTPYNVVYHEPTRRFIVSGGNSQLLLFLDADTGDLADVMVFDGSVRYLTYDPYRDRLLVDVRSRRCLVEVDPYSAEETDCYFKEIALDSKFQLGCFNSSGDVLSFSVDTDYRLYRRDYKTSSEEMRDIFPFSCAYGMVCLGDRVVMSSMCPSPLLRSGLWVMNTSSRLEVVRKKRLIFPALDMEYDRSSDLLYLARPILNRVDVYSAKDLSKVKALDVPKGTRELALDGEGRFLYAGSMSTGGIVKIDLRTEGIEARYEVGPLLRDLSFVEELDAVLAVSACGVFRLSADAEPVRTP